MNIHALLAASALAATCGIGGWVIADEMSARPVPPGPARAELRVGDRVEAHRLHMIGRPGLYGLGPEPEGSAYAVVDSKLVRVDTEKMVIRAIIRPGVQPVD